MHMSHTARPNTHSPSSDRSVVVVGGGFSGLAAAIELTMLNIPVVLLEQKPKLGGRAYSFVDETTGDVIDNGQHVLIAGYDHTMRFLERIGTRHLLSIQQQPILYLHHPTRGLCEFRLPALVPPFHLIAGILSTNLLTLRDKMRLLRAGWLLQRGAVAPDHQTIEQWLEASGQSEELKRSFWEPLAISIMNEHIAHASAKVFVHALRHAFLAAWKNAALALPRVGLSDLYVDAAAKFLTSRGAAVHVNSAVARLGVEGGRMRDVHLRDGRVIPCAAVILAVPHYEARDLTQEVLTDESLRAVGAIPSTPIVSIHLWFEEDFMKLEFVGLIDRRVQWVFNKRKIAQERGTGGHVSCVISGAEEFVSFSNEQLVQLALEDLRTLYRRASKPTHAIVIREKRATFSCTPDAERVRPPQQTSIPNLFLAGDWTNTGLPATIEGAILSGERCAHLAAACVRTQYAG
jgi:squalene-associated FAD-dependent desaturase